MFLVRAILGLVFLAFAIATVPMWFTTPIAILFTMIFAVLGLWIMGWVSRFSPKRVRDENAIRERAIRQSKYFGLRNRSMWAIALFFGLVGLYIAHENDWAISDKAIFGYVAFIAIGLWYLIKGARAESGQ